jgi:hypothetical protein
VHSYGLHLWLELAFASVFPRSAFSRRLTVSSSVRPSGLACLTSMLKVHIVGLPSSGKTTLGSGLSSSLGVPHYDLDSVAYVDDRWTLRPAKDRDELVTKILAGPGFVTEGHFVGWVSPLCAGADLIVWLDPPLRVLIWRHVRRHGRLRQPLWLLGRLRFQVLCYFRPAGKGPAEDDPDLTRSGIETMLRPWAEKVLRVRHPGRVAEVIEKLPAG